jgi:hypothetical protein
MCLQDAKADLQESDQAAAVGGINEGIVFGGLQEVLQLRVRRRTATATQQQHATRRLLLAGHCWARGFG